MLLASHTICSIPATQQLVCDEINTLSNALASYNGTLAKLLCFCFKTVEFV